ncbi:MAG: MCE family protein [Nocardioidaceae bacterium]|nr:MCE family protein [Nocardioidaceae bacterium]MCL2611790.1 MCE family protein [Nocardioidaceae bacterium]
MKPMNERDPFKVGLVGLAMLLVLGLFVVVISTVNFGDKSYTAQLQNTGGLRKGEDVEVHGVSEGKVTGLSIQGTHVEVQFALSKSITLGNRTTAAVKVATLLGTHYLQVEPQGSGELAGDIIPLDRTTTPYNLQDVIQKGHGALQKLDPQLLAKALTQMSDTLGASQGEIGPALQGVARLSEVVANRSDQLGQLLTSARNVSTQLSDSSQDIIGLMKQTNLVVAEVTARRTAIHRLLVETTGLSRALTAIVNATNGKLKPALHNINNVIDGLNGESGQLKKVLTVMAPAARYVANATGSGPYVGLYLKPPALPADNMR